VNAAGYCDAIKAQSITLEQPDEEALRQAFSDLLINDRTFATLGRPSTRDALFLYGYPHGKTSMPSVSPAASEHI